MSRLVLLFLYLITGISVFAQKECVSTQYQEELQKKPSALQSIATANSFLNNYRPEIFMGSDPGTAPGTLPVINIPVVVHILYKDASQNISDEQVLSQIDILNKAFQLQHADTGKIPAHFRELAANCRINFCLAKVDPKGYATSGIVRKSTWVTMYSIDDRIKYSGMGGDDAWPRDKYLNIWVGNLVAGLAGYSSPIGGPAETDGIAVRPTAFGTKGTTAAPYHMGRTTVHEVGHWLGLRHIWGDATCGDDLVHDTPKQRTSNRGCPSGIKASCDNAASGEMYMNYMDLTSDDCMLMFSVGQMERMRSAFAPGGPRYGILSSQGCTGTALPEPAAAPETAPVVKLIDLYPNPARGRLVIDIKENTELLGAQVQIRNQVGQPVMTLKLTQTKTTIDAGRLQSGMYIISIDGGSKKYQEKFLKL
ncbi:MAG: M43 family zinc metalloprotease [Chitinophagaceae bacterium]